MHSLFTGKVKIVVKIKQALYFGLVHIWFQK